jgi:hypothetical protein
MVRLESDAAFRGVAHIIEESIADVSGDVGTLYIRSSLVEKYHAIC